MKFEGPLFHDQNRILEVPSEVSQDGPEQVVTTRDHEVIKRWAHQRKAEPATGEATTSGPAKVNVNDGGAGIRFNFPGMGLFRPIGWDEWFSNFDDNRCMFIYENDAPDGAVSNRYRIVKAEDLKARLA
jgi:hypothetical protein